ncbi:MAG: fibronectin type III domain-containing protein, partial [Clostridia bacterium]|nr:fibronectin type III domain-containing protein [Clostridia bacterium]
MDVLVPEGEIDNPDNVTGVTAIARQNEIVIQWNLNADDGLHNSIANYIVQVSKDSGNTWNTGNQVTGNSTSYIFNRDTNADGFPERETFATWRVRVTAVNIYGKNSTPTV